MSGAIEIDRVTAGYGETPIIRDLSFVVQPGEITAVIGPNGAGKTTLLRSITGLIEPFRGAIRLFGEDLARLPAGRRARLVGVVPQTMETPMAFTVAEIVMMGRTTVISRWRQPSAEDRHMVERAMVYTDVADMKNRPFSDLSGGEKQRAIIAMVLAQEPKLILMDEATSHLDINHRLEVMQIVERLNREQGTTVLIVSHDLNLSAEFCRRLLLLDHGAVVADGSPAEVMTEDLLSRVYHCDVRVQRNPANGSVSVVPAPRLTPGCSGRGIRVHVVAGGGCGEDILRRLSLNEYAISCGVLNQGDSDADVAEALGIETALEKPFSPIGHAALEAARQMVSRADAVIVCGVPFGPGNVVNLDLAEQALKAKKRVFVMEGIRDRDYTPNRDAARKSAALLAAGATPWRTITDLFALLSPSAAAPVPP